ncbi:hypothetical protein NQZ68_026493 [Dissostichus eleginoides]|nr:hypothetical protein NQZ68_026493 [Dissostichus eleginoides]
MGKKQSLNDPLLDSGYPFPPPAYNPGNPAGPPQPPPPPLQAPAMQSADSPSTPSSSTPIRPKQRRFSEAEDEEQDLQTTKDVSSLAVLNIGSGTAHRTLAAEAEGDSEDGAIHNQTDLQQMGRKGAQSSETEIQPAASKKGIVSNPRDGPTHFNSQGPH